MMKECNRMVRVYGGNLVQALDTTTYRSVVEDPSRATSPRINLSPSEFFDLHMLAIGAYSPIDGYMDEENYRSVCDHMVLSSGVSWGLPVTLSVPAITSTQLEPGMEAVLSYQSIPVALLHIKDVYRRDIRYELAQLYAGCKQIPNIKNGVYEQNTRLIGGKITLLSPINSYPLPGVFLHPSQVREMRSNRENFRVASILTDTPWTRAHEYAMKSILECTDSILMHISDNREMNKVLLPRELSRDLATKVTRDFFPEEKFLSRFLYESFPMHTPRGVLQTAIVSQNYGSACLLISNNQIMRENRDQTEKVIADAASSGLETDVLFMEKAFYCDKCDSIATTNTCHHDSKQHTISDDQKLIEKIYSGEHVPAQLVRPEIARYMSRGVSMKLAKKRIGGGKHIYPHATELGHALRYSITGHKGCVLWLTGLSGSGKSTLAIRAEKELLLTGHRVFLLDGDSLRNGLCRDLDFSRESRRENLRRAGEMCKLLCESGQMVIASFISPYIKERQMIREIIGDSFYEVYVKASLDTCERRDPKGLYQRARAGIIPEFTGISSPYEIPEQPVLTIDTTHKDVESCALDLLTAMREMGLLSVGAPIGYLKIAESVQEGSITQ